MYHFQEKDGLQFSLHDCRAEQMRFSEHIMSFVFPDGVWALPGCTHNESGNTVRTDCAQVDFHIIDAEEVSVYLFKPSVTGAIVRTEWELDRFMQAVNDGKYQVEFIDAYQGYQSQLFKCWVWFDRKPYHYECELLLPCEEATYRWNRLRYDRVW